MSHYYRYGVVAALCCLYLFGAEIGDAQTTDFPDEYNVVWDSQSKNSGGSMPVSKGISV